MSPEVEECLFSFVTSFPEIQALNPPDFMSLRDGIAIATLWNLISSPKVNVSVLTQWSSSGDWLVVFKNLRVIDQVIAPVLQAMGIWQEIKIMEIAKKNSKEELAKFITPLVLVALHSPIKKDVVARMKRLSKDHQNILQKIIESKQIGTQQQEESQSSKAQIQSTELEIESIKKSISELEQKLRDLEAQSKRTFRKVDEGQAHLISQTSDLLSSILVENSELNYELQRLQSTENELLESRDRVSRLQKENEGSSEKMRVSQCIESLSSGLRRGNRMTKRLVELQKQHNEVENQVLAQNKEINLLKDEITTAVQLGEKYVSTSSEPAENEGDESVTELANRISQLDSEIAILKDAIESGENIVSPNIIKEQEDLKRMIGRLLKQKKRLAADSDRRSNVRLEMHRIQQLMVDQREEVELELARLTADVNQRNLELMDWLSFSTSFESWRGSSTFLSDLRRKLF
jgi:myosin heavy subunit